MKVRVRFAGILTFVRMEDKVVVFAAEAGAPGNGKLRIPKKFWPHHPHQPEITFRNARFVGPKPGPSAHKSSFQLSPTGNGTWRNTPKWSDLHLLNLTDLCVDNVPANEERSAVILDARLRGKPPYESNAKTLVSSRFELEPDDVTATRFCEKWGLSLYASGGRHHPAEVQAVLSTEAGAVLKYGPLTGDGDVHEVTLSPENSDQEVEIYFNHLYKGRADRDARHYAVHYHLMNTPGHLMGLLPIPQPPSDWSPSPPGERTSPLHYGPESLNPQCSPAELSAE